MKRIHFTDPYLLDPQHPVTVNVIGAGGTGGRVLTHLASLDTTLRALGHPGLYVTLYDPDVVEEPNLGRQLFSPSELGLNKAVCLISRVNNFFGNGWRAVGELFPATVGDAGKEHLANITITCTDNIKSRLDMDSFLKKVVESRPGDPYATPIYWIDIGNSKTTGQVVLGTCGKVKQPSSKEYKTVPSLKPITRMVNYSAIDVKEQGPSCSQAEALEKQDLYINSTLAVFGCDILWKLFRHGWIEHHGAYVNLDTMRVNPLSV